jgi:hypothetical protein
MKCWSEGSLKGKPMKRWRLCGKLTEIEANFEKRMSKWKADREKWKA